VIGGTNAADRNVISANGNNGIAMTVLESTRIQGNFIGADATGTNVLANARGISMDQSTDVTISGNVVAGSLIDGILIQQSQSVQIDGNRIGTNWTGALNLGNEGRGLALSGVTNVVVGSAVANVIAFNQSGGVLLYNQSADNLIEGNLIFANFTGVQLIGSSVRNRILGNSISGNEPGPGIDLADCPTIHATATPGTTCRRTSRC
jgi:parallel beta-helix repeat protein